MTTRQRRRAQHGSIGWWMGLAALAALGLGIRLAYLLAFRSHVALWGDPFYYHNAANLLVSGHGFVNPVPYTLSHPPRVVQGADFPPLFPLVLAAASLVGFKSVFAHQVWCCIIGTGTVVVVGLAGREMAGRRAGLLAALVAAAYPNFWLNDPLVHAETLSLLLIALVVLISYRFWRQPRLLTAVTLGGVLGLAILARDEEALLVPLVLLPMILLAKAERNKLGGRQAPRVDAVANAPDATAELPLEPRFVPIRRRLAMLGASVLAVLVVIAPWVGYNMSRFQDPVLISTGLGVTLTSANCNKTYYGTYTGYWWPTCIPHVPKRAGDESGQDLYLRQYALRYVGDHTGRLPFLVAARLGRGFGFYQPTQQLRLDSFFELRAHPSAVAGLWTYYVLLAASVAGFAFLWRRRVTVIPVVGITLATVVTMVVSFGQTRYRAPFEVVLALLSAVAVDGLVRALAHRRRMAAGGRQATPESGAPEPPAREPVAIQAMTAVRPPGLG